MGKWRGETQRLQVGDTILAIGELVYTVERDVPAPPLPTTPFVVIRGKQAGELAHEYILLRNGAWLGLYGEFLFNFGPDQLDLDHWELVSYPPTYQPVTYECPDGTEQKG